MGYVMTAEIKLTDKVSPVLNDIGTNGKRIIAGMEEDFAKVNSSMNNTSKTAAQVSASLARLSGDTSQAASHSRELATAMVDEAEKMRKAAQTAQMKADKSERMAEIARRNYTEIEKQIAAEAKSKDASEKSTKAMNEKATAALLEAERLEKVSAELRKKADAAEKAADAAQDNARAALEAAQADEKLHTSATKTAVGEKQVADALNKSEQQAEEYVSAVRRASNESEKLGRQGESTAQLLESAFTALAVERVIVGIKDAFVACSKAAIEYESAITGVYKTVNGSEAQLSEISDEIKLMSLEIPSTTTEIAGVAESAGQLGIETENVTGFTEVMINLGESTNLAADEAASYLAKYSNITGMAADKYENLGSTVVALGNNFATTEADIVAMATRMASAGTLAGLTESDILGLAAAMSSVGIEADAGGSAMSTLLSNIQIAVETGNDSLNDFSSVANMTAEEFQTAFKDNAAGALYAFIDGLNDVERNGATATVVLENMGITEIRLSNAVKALANNSDGLSGAIKLAGEAWDENTALATEAELRYGTLESRLNITRNAANNLKIAIGDVLNPVVGDFADAGTDALVWLTEFTENNPTVVAGITGVTTALGLAAGAVTVCSTVVTAFNTAMKALNITISASKLGIIIGTIGVAGGIIGSLAYHFSSAEEQVEDYNGTLMQCREEIEATETSYRNVCDMYGENSQEAQSLSAELDTLNAQYEKGGGAIEEYSQRLTESSEALDRLRTEYDSKLTDISNTQTSGMIAVANLESLSEKAQLTNADLDLMSNYADYLNNTFNCDIKVNYDTGEITNLNPEDIAGQIIDKTNSDKTQLSMDFITNGTDEFVEQIKIINGYRDTVAEAENKLAELKKLNNDDDGWTAFDSDWGDEYGSWYDYSRALSAAENEVENTKDSLKTAEEELNKLDADFKYHANIVDESGETYNILRKSLEETALNGNDYITMMENATETTEKIKDPLEAAHEAVELQADEIYKLAEAYDEAYNAAYESFMGQFGLFDEAQMNTEATVENAQTALDSQLEYWTAYSENISYLSSVSAETLGITQANYDLMMQYVRSGDAEAAGLAESMVAHIENGNTEVVGKMAETLGEIDSKQSESAELVAEWETNIEEHMNQAFNTAEQSIQKIEGLDGNVKNAAVKIIRSYAQGIRDTQSVAVTAASNLAAAVQAKFNSVSIKIPSLSSENSNPDNQYASGTLSAKSGLALVGERGPELVVLQGGERIYTASETERILNNSSMISSAFNEKELIFNNSKSTVSNIFSSENDTSEISRNIFSSSESENVLQSFSDKTLFIPPPDSPVKPFERNSDSASKREFSIDINGKGSIDVKGSMNKEQVVEILFDHMKPVLMNILAQEIFEEGDNTYEI
ncbi:MAG: phage tail tape measure protein [Oscillospiraceae bacterium]|nr:phage tail tape measure protein [Oscillospiraceae bacterium]